MDDVLADLDRVRSMLLGLAALNGAGVIVLALGLLRIRWLLAKAKTLADAARPPR